MFDDVADPLTGIAAAVDHLVTTACALAAPGGGSAADLIAGLERLQRVANLAAACEQQVLARLLDDEGWEQFGAPSPQALLMDRLRVRRSEAATRVRRAKAAGPRTSLTGEPLPPSFPRLAAAQRDGAVSGDHVDVVGHALRKLAPHTTPAQHEELEKILVDLAEAADPESVAKAGREALNRFDPDGPEPRDIERRRTLSCRQRDDGMGEIRALVTPEAFAKFEALMSPLAAPCPKDAGGQKDSRSVGQRQHDAFEELLDRLLATAGMPNHGGVPLTVIVVMDIEDLIARTGTARTAFGTTVPVKRLLEQASEMQVVPVVTSKVDGILAFGQNRRIASTGQALALIGRDRGCTFPGCSRPAVWCQRHHVREVVADNGETDVDNLVLVCAYHHRHFGRWGWAVALVDGHPWWTPPAVVDPDRKPIRNSYHDPPDLRPARQLALS